MKLRPRSHDPFESAAWSGRPAMPVFEHTAANTTFLATRQGPLTQVNVGQTRSRVAQLNAAERSPLEARYPGIAMAITDR